MPTPRALAERHFGAMERRAHWRQWANTSPEHGSHGGNLETSKQLSSSEKNLKEVDLLENANKGDPKAQYNLGLMALASSKKKDINRALNWFNLAAIQEFPPAQYGMGVLYDKGLGVTENKSTALLWYH